MKNNSFSISPPIAQSALAGIANNDFCQLMLNLGSGMVTLGGFSIDQKTQAATLEMISRGRIEVQLPSEINEIEIWSNNNLKLIKKKSNQLISNNVRIASRDVLSRLWLKQIMVFADIIEINAHCRQKEIMNVGGGQKLLTDLSKLEEILAFMVDVVPSFRIGIKVRGYMVDEPLKLIKIIDEYGIRYLHVDAMFPGFDRANIKIIRNFVDITETPIIGNNSVRSFKEINEMLEAGCVATSIGRPLIENPEFMNSLIKEFTGKKNEDSNNHSL